MELRLWQLPKWVSYLIGLGGAILTFLLRRSLEPVLGDDAAYVFFTIPVALAAFVGGVWPCLATSALSMAFALYFFVPPKGTLMVMDAHRAVIATVILCTWVFFGVVCELLRSAAISYQRATIERDEVRDRVTAILDGISDAFYAVDNEWRIIHTNQAFLNLVDRAEDDILGVDLWTLSKLPELDHLGERIRQSKSSRERFSLDVKHPSSARWLHVRGFPHRHGMFVYIQDVTTRVQLKESLDRQLANERAAREHAENASRLKDEFVATLSHELRTPLTAIPGWVELILGKGTSAERLEEGLAAIDRSARVQSGLIQELLDMSRISAGKLRLETTVLDLREIVRDATEIGRPASENKSIQFSTEMPDEEVWVRGDPGRLHQILSNLVSNAIKFSLNRGNVRVRLESTSFVALVVVEDDGEGIDPSFLPFVFDRFRQGNASRSRVHGGLGLGLAIARQLVELHGGKISVESAGLGTGARFLITLPLAPVSPGMMSMKLVPPIVESARLTGVTVLLVDDDRETREVLPLFLIDAGAVVHTAASAEEAMAMLPRVRPDVLLSDIGMPNMDGYEFIRRIRAHEDDLIRFIPAIALTAFARSEDRELSISAGFTDHRNKPIEARELVSAVARVI